MTARLLVRYRGPGRPLAWIALDERDRVLSGPYDESPIPAATIAAAREVVVLAPAEAVLLAETQVNARSREQLEKAVPFALEEQIAEPIESLQVAVVSTATGQLVAAVRRAELDAWVADLGVRGLRADRIVPESAALPLAPGRATVLVEGERALVRLTPGRAFAVDTGELAMFLSVADTARDAKGRVPVLLAEFPDTQVSSRSAARVRGNADNETWVSGNFDALDIERADDPHPLRLLARGLRQGEAPNLLSGTYAPGHRDAPVVRAWRFAAILAGVLVVLAFAHAVLDWIVLRERLATLEAAQADVYRSAFPEARRIVDPVAQMKGELGRLSPASHGVGAMPLLARVAPVVTQSTQITLQGIEYRGGVLELAVSAAAVGTLDALRESVSALPNLQAELASATTTQTGTEGRLRIQERAR